MTSAGPLTTTPRTLPFEQASWARRVVALVVDWLASMLVAGFIVGWRDFTTPGGIDQLVVLVVYVVETALLTALAGGSFGKLATRLRTVRVTGDPRPLDPLRSVARQILVAVAVPPLIFRPDGRGLHDIWCGSATVTLQTYRSFFLGLDE